MPFAMRGSAAEGASASASGSNMFDGGILSHAVMSNLGNSSAMTHAKPTGPFGYGEWTFPVIPYGVPTTIIPVAFPLTRAPTNTSVLMQEQVQLLGVFFAALMVWMLPTLCINKRLCPLFFRRWISKRLGCYFFLGLVLNVSVISVFISRAGHVDANALFFTAVSILEQVTNQMEGILIQVLVVGALAALYVFRSKLAMILGFDQQILKVSLRDIVTGFSMKRFRAIEISLWQSESLPVGFTSRTLFTRITLGYNEPAHTRPHDNVKSMFSIRERIQLNYDPEDDTQKLSVVVKIQEVIGATINQLLPAAGGAIGAVAGMASPLGPGPGAALGVVTGTGAANSVGADVARVDLSSAMINRIRARCAADSAPAPSSERPSQRVTSTGPAVKWSEEFFQKVDMIPQGQLWIRIADIEGAVN